MKKTEFILSAASQTYEKRRHTVGRCRPTFAAARLALSPLTTQRRSPSFTARRLALSHYLSPPGAARHLAPPAP
eukprot:6191075-Pleurochrysis_carterae.AAC.1